MSQRITWTDWSDGNIGERYGTIGDLRLFIAHRTAGGPWHLDTSLPPFDRVGSFGGLAEVEAAAEARLNEFVTKIGASF